LASLGLFSAANPSGGYFRFAAPQISLESHLLPLYKRIVGQRIRVPAGPRSARGRKLLFDNRNGTSGSWIANAP